jgi:hypothetical protein
MTVQPLFRPGVKAQWTLAGSSLQLTLRLLLTCDHVLRGDPSKPTSHELREDEVAAGVNYIGVARLIRAKPAEPDLALVELRQPVEGQNAAFSRQWTIHNIHGYGFSDPPFDRVESDGPIELSARGSRVHISFSHGMPEGFSGGPAIGEFRGTEYCVGLNWMGGVDRAMGVLIPAAACVEFVDRHFPGVCRLNDLAERDLEEFLVEQYDALQQMRRGHSRWSIATAFSPGRASNTLTPLRDISAMNCQALKCLNAGAEPAAIAVALEGREFGRRLRNSGSYADMETVLLGHLRATLPGCLTIPDCWQRSFREGRVTLFVLGYERTYLADDYDLVRVFMNRFAARSAHA